MAYKNIGWTRDTWENIAVERAKKMAERTHCANGHRFTPENTRMETVHKNGKEYFVRKCRACNRERQQNKPAKA